MKAKEDKQELKKKFILRLVFIIISLLIFIYLYFLLSEFGANPFIIILILAFVFFIFSGPVLKKNFFSSLLFRRKSNLFKISEKNKHRRFRIEEKGRGKNIKNNTKLEQNLSESNKPINIDFKYRKPILRKCGNCGMILASFVKQCPLCGKQIDSTD
jgi:hypothetical protein